jgi:hypothetical protein
VTPKNRKRAVATALMAVVMTTWATVPAAQAHTTGSTDAGAKNVVVVLNRQKDGFQGRGNVQVIRLPGPNASPVNVAEAGSSCVNCQTLAVAFQIDLISGTATTIAPRNAAIATNYDCTGCYTVARAIQYVIQVDDPERTPPRVQQLVTDMDRALTAIQSDRTMTVAEAERRVEAVLGQFVDLAEWLIQARDHRESPAAADAPAEGTTETLTPTAT